MAESPFYSFVYSASIAATGIHVEVGSSYEAAEDIFNMSFKGARSSLRSPFLYSHRALNAGEIGAVMFCLICCMAR